MDEMKSAIKGNTSENLDRMIKRTNLPFTTNVLECPTNSPFTTSVLKCPLPPNSSTYSNNRIII